MGLHIPNTTSVLTWADILIGCILFQSKSTKADLGWWLRFFALLHILMYSCGFLTSPEKGLGVLFDSLPSPAIVTQKLHFEPRRDKMSLSGVIHWSSCSWSKLRFSLCSLLHKCVALVAMERIPMALTHCL